MVKVIMKSSIAGADFSFIPGQKAEIDEELALKWQEAGICEYDEVDILLSEKDNEKENAIAEILVNAEKEKEDAIAEAVKKVEEDKELAVNIATDTVKKGFEIEINKLTTERDEALKEIALLKKQLAKAKEAESKKTE